jgi:hypothetical protein
MTRKKKKEDVGKRSIFSIFDKIFVSVTVVFIGLIGLLFIYYTFLILDSTSFNLLTLIPIVFSLLFLADFILLLRRKKLFIEVSMFLLCCIIVGAISLAFIIPYVTGLAIIGTRSVAFLSVIFFSVVSIFTLIFSKTIKKYLCIEE